MQKQQQNKLQRLLARAPVFLLLALAFLLCKPMPTQAKEKPLERNMPYFQYIQCYNAIETNGANLNAMFGTSMQPVSSYGVKLPKNRQYIAFFQIDTEKSTNASWYTHTLYVHTKPWGYEIPNDKSDVLFSLYVKEKSKSDNFGKVSFKYYIDNLNTGNKKYVGSGKIGTLFYFCVDTGTTYGDALENYRQKNKDTLKKTNQVKIYISPVIGAKNFDKSPLWYNLVDWKRIKGTNCQVKPGLSNWRDSSTFASHYDVPMLFEVPSIKVTYRASVVNKRKSGDDGTEYAATQKQLDATKSPRGLEKDDYIFTVGDSLDINGADPATVEYEAYSDKSFKLINPMKYCTGYDKCVTTDPGDSPGQTMICVGYRIMKRRADGTKVILAASMIELEKNSAGEFVPLFVADKTGETTEVDTDSEGNPLSEATDINTAKVTIMRYNKYNKVSNGKLDKNDKFSSGEVVPLTKWLNDINSQHYWCTSANYGIGGKNTNYDGTEDLKGITVDWYYAPITIEKGGTVPGEAKITLQQYYTTETTNIDTVENPSVDDSADLSYTHNSKKHEAQIPIILDTVDYGSPWVSYSVKQNDSGQYVLKDGSVSPKRKTTEDGSGSINVKQSKVSDKSFKNVNPTCDFTKKDLVEIKNERTDMTTSSIPYVLKRTTAGSKYESTGNNYLYRVVIKTDKDDVWTEFTAEDIWGKTVPANGKIVKGKSTNRSYTTNAPYMRSYVYQEKKDAVGLIKSKNADWQQDAFNMTHFIIPSVDCDITIEAYYTTTVPVRTLVYKQDSSGKFILQDSETRMSWVSAGVNYYGTFSGNADSVIAATGRKAYSTPYAVKQRKQPSFNSITAAEKYYPDRIKCQTTTSDFTIKVKTEPITVCIFIGIPSSSKYFTQAQYVHTQDGAYHLLKSWRQPIRNLYGPMTCPGHPSEEGTWYHEYLARTVKAFVSFPEYVSWDDGNTGLYGDHDYFEYSLIIDCFKRLILFRFHFSYFLLAYFDKIIMKISELYGIMRLKDNF